MNQYLGLLFDLDGVIVDTAKYHFLAWQEIADELKIPFTKQDNERLKGVSRIHSFQIILDIGNRTMAEKEIEKYCTKKNEIYLTYILKMTETEILPGVEEFLIDVKKKGYKIALGSASRNAQLILDRVKLTDYFDEVIDGNKVTHAKPNPEVFENGARALGLSGNQCIVFEDAEAGICAAHNCNMKAVGIGSADLLPKADLNLAGFSDITIEEIVSRLE